MVAVPLRRVLALLVLGLAVAASPARAGQYHCPFCSMQGQTLVGDVDQASMVLYGTFTNAKLNNDGSGTTDLEIEAVIKKHDILGDKKVLTMPRFVPVNKNSKEKFLVFCDVYKEQIDPYRGVPVAADSDMVKYLEGALAVKGKSVTDRLKFYFDFLDNKEIEISNDAYKEFGNADYKDFAPMAKVLPAARIIKWLEDPNTAAFRYGLYASMLGHCGKPSDAAVLRKMLEDPAKRSGSGVDGILAGYTMLNTKEGWGYIRSVLGDPKAEFMLRYAALRAIRFLWDSVPGLVDKKEMVGGVELLLDQGDIADLAIEDLRKWGRWEALDRILNLRSLKTHEIPIIKKSILRFALSCPDPKAAAVVAEWRKTDPETVKDTEELLKLEASNKTP